jgi:hypothetical protein
MRTVLAMKTIDVIRRFFKPFSDDDDDDDADDEDDEKYFYTNDCTGCISYVIMVYSLHDNYVRHRSFA